MASKYEEITSSLVSDLQRKSLTWERIYANLKAVKELHLYAEAGLPSFSAYVNELAKLSRCHVSYVWRVWQAGSYFATLTSTPAGQELAQEIEGKGIRLGDEVLALTKTISGADPDKGVELVRKYMDGQLTKKDLSAAAKSHRKARNGGKNDAEDGRNGHGSGNAGAGSGVEDRVRVVAADIMLALKPEVFALQDRWRTLSGKGDDEPLTVRKGHRLVYEVLSEFPVHTGDTRHARRVDAMVIANVDAGDFGAAQDAVTLRAVEIKVDKHDLINDTKMGEYEPFADRCYLAVPEDLQEDAVEVLLPGWGLLVYDSNKKRLQMAQEADLKPGEKRMETLGTLAVKKLQSAK